MHFGDMHSKMDTIRKIGEKRQETILTYTPIINKLRSQQNKKIPDRFSYTSEKLRCDQIFIIEMLASVIVLFSCTCCFKPIKQKLRTNPI